MRILSPQAQAVLAGPGPVPMAALLEMQLSETVYLCSWDSDIEWNGITWRATGNLGAIEAVEDTASELRGLRFSLSGVPSDSVSLALSENIQGKPCIVRLALLDPETHAVADVQVVWSGTLDQMPLADGANPSIGATAEHRGVTMQRPKPLRYTDLDQQRPYPGDRCLQYVTAQANQQITWPSSDFFKR